jgi:hypothetical protein
MDLAVAMRTNAFSSFSRGTAVKSAAFVFVVWAGCTAGSFGKYGEARKSKELPFSTAKNP